MDWSKFGPTGRGRGRRTACVKVLCGKGYGRVTYEWVGRKRGGQEAHNRKKRGPKDRAIRGGGMIAVRKVRRSIGKITNRKKVGVLPTQKNKNGSWKLG